MANTVTESWGKRTLELIYEGNGDDFTCSREIRVKSVFFYPSAAADILHVREGSLTGATIFKVTSIAGETIPSYLFGDTPITPCIKLSECTLGVPANAVISIDFD
jgi:hypothetical protein